MHSHPQTPHFIWDMIVPIAPVVGNGIDLLARYHAAGHSYVSLTIAGDDCLLAEAMHRLAQVRSEIVASSDQLVLATSVEEILTAKRQGKLAVGLHLEGTECLERDPFVIDLMYELGIRHGILAFNRNNSAAGGCADLGNVGLSRLGKRYLDRMRAVGMLLDLSHTSERASMEAMEYLGRPVVFTHSNSRALQDHYRNVTDQQAKACAATGGLIGISGSSGYLGAAPSLAEGVFRHIDYFVQLLGAEHVGLGTDYIVDSEEVQKIFVNRPDEWPVDVTARYDALAYLPPEDIRVVIGHMENAGYGDEAIAAVLGQNYVRIAREIWR